MGSVKKPKVKTKISARRTVLTSLVVDTLDVVANIIVAIITGSVVMLAEAIQGVADFISVLFVFVGLKKSSKKVSKKHPIGSGKALYFWTFMATIIMFLFTSTIIFYFGFMNFLNPEAIENIALAYIVLVIFVISNGYAFSVSSRRILDGKKCKEIINVFKNSSLVETKTTLVLDFIGTLAALIGLVALLLYKFTGDMRFDGLGAMAIGICIMSLTIFLIKDLKNLLVGKSASPDIERKIRSIISDTDEVKKVLGFYTLNIGLGRILVHAEIHLENNLVTDEIEEIVRNIEKRIKKKVPEAKQIHIEIRAKKTKK